MHGADPDVAVALAVAPQATGERVCLAARRSGLLRSLDGGASWVPVPGMARSLTALAIAPHGDPTVVAGTVGGVLRSTDVGATWQAVPLAAPPPVVSILAISPAFVADGVVLAGTLDDGLFRSTDHGATWRRANVGLFDPSVLALAISPAFAADQTVLLGAATGIYLSTTGGRSWRDLDGPEDAPVVAVAIAIAPDLAGGALLFAGTEGAGLFRSADGGDHWQRVVPRDTDIVRIDVAPGPEARPEVLVVLTDGLIRSRDGGASWSECAIDLAPSEIIVSAVALDGAGADGHLLAGLASGAIRRITIR